MRFSIILYFLLCAASYLCAQSAPAPIPAKIISEDDLKLGIYDAPAFQSSVRSVTVRKPHLATNNDGLAFVLSPDTPALKRIRYTPSYYRLQAACGQSSDHEDFMAFLLEIFNGHEVSSVGVARQE